MQLLLKTAYFFAEGAELLSVHYEVCYHLDNCTSDLVQKNAVHHCFSFKQLKALARYWFTLEVLRIMVEVFNREPAGGFCQSVGYVHVENNCWKARGLGEKAMLIGKFVLTVFDIFGKNIKKSVVDLLAEHWFLPFQWEALVFIFM